MGKVSDVRVIEAATSVELVQVGSLVHDDIFDEAQTRRGTPTINALEGPNEALLAGTVLLARAAAKAASAGQRVAQEVAHTVAQLCLGQLTETEHLFDLYSTGS
jgi:heptaprenyl diphosphate synthase